MSSQALASKSLIGIVRSASLADAARLMVHKNIGALGVYSVDQHELLGVITERDIARRSRPRLGSYPYMRLRGDV